MERPFGWVPFRIVHSGLLAQLSTGAKLLYFVLCTVSDRDGLSFWGEGRLCELLRLSATDLQQARTELCERDLLAFDGWLYQLLSLPQLLPIGKATNAQRRPRSAERQGTGAVPNASASARGPAPASEIVRRLLRGIDHAD
jgi:hypothetical protein